MTETDDSIVISTDIIEIATRKITLTAVLLFFTVINVAVFIVPKNTSPVLGTWISVAVGILVMWISTWKFWHWEKGPWVLQKPPFKNDLVISQTLTIYFSKGKLIGGLVVAGLSILIGAVILIRIFIGPFAPTDNGSYISNIVADLISIILIGIYFFYTKFRWIFNNRPQLVISDKGINNTQVGFYPWAEISNESANVQGGNKIRMYYLIYDCPAGRVNLNIGSYDLSYEELNYLLKIYRGRYENQ